MQTSQLPPPMPRPRNRNSVLRLYDGPVYRDWAFWLTVGNVVLGGVSMTASTAAPSTNPLWLDMILGAVLLGFMFGIVPAWLRLWIRRWTWRRRQRSPQTITPTQDAPLQQPQPSQFPMQWAGPATWQQRTAMPEPRQQDHVPPQAPWNAPRPEQSAGPPRPTSPPPPPPPGPNPSAADDLAVARGTLPHPVARSVRVLQQAHVPRDRYDAILDIAEALAITICVTVAAILRDQGKDASSDDPAARALATLRSAYTGPGAMFGTWTSWLTNLRPLLSQRPELIPGLSDALDVRGDIPGIVDELNTLRLERNRAAHGDRPHTAHEYAVRAGELMPTLRGALRHSAFLRQSPWLLTVSCSFQPRSQVFDVVTRRVMGDHPDFETQNFTWRQPVADDMFYVLGPTGPVLMSPFVASRFCNHCNQVEVCYAYRTGKREGPATFKSFDSGHDIGVDELGDDLRGLPERN